MKLVILGGGESGVGAAILGKTKGYEVFLSDFGTIPERYRIQLDEEGIEWEQGATPWTASFLPMRWSRALAYLLQPLW